jgi:hypothetical protein
MKCGNGAPRLGSLRLERSVRRAAPVRPTAREHTPLPRRCESNEWVEPNADKRHLGIPRPRAPKGVGIERRAGPRKVTIDWHRAELPPVRPVRGAPSFSISERFDTNRQPSKAACVWLQCWRTSGRTHRLLGNALGFADATEGPIFRSWRMPDGSSEAI